MHINLVSYILDVYVHAMVWEGWRMENTAKQSWLHGAHGMDGPVLARLFPVWDQSIHCEIGYHWYSNKSVNTIYNNYIAGMF